MTTIYKIYEDGTIASITFLYRNEEIQSYYVGVRPDADGVWPDYNSDYAFTSVIVVKPFDDGTFRIISNDVTEQELKLPPVAYS